MTLGWNDCLSLFLHENFGRDIFLPGGRQMRGPGLDTITETFFYGLVSCRDLFLVFLSLFNQTKSYSCTSHFHYGTQALVLGECPLGFQSISSIKTSHHNPNPVKKNKIKKKEKKRLTPFSFNPKNQNR